MRLSFLSRDHLSAAAKFLARLSPNVTHSAALEALARAAGFRDWHEFSSCPADPNDAPTRVDLLTAIAIAHQVADRLNLLDGDVQFCLDKAGLLGGWGLDDHLAARAQAWRTYTFGPPARGKSGTLVKAGKSRGCAKAAYLLRDGRPTVVFGDHGVSTFADFEIVTPRLRLDPFVPLRLWLPYGYWTLADGSEVIFSRDYFPMWRVSAAGVERLSPWLWINGIAEQTWLAGKKNTHNWWTPEVVAAARDHLHARRIRALPRLADMLPELVALGTDKVEDGLTGLYLRLAANEAIPSYAEVHSWRLREIPAPAKAVEGKRFPERLERIGIAEDGRPILPAFREYKDGKPTVHLRAWCPECGKFHGHGGGNAVGKGDGHRVAHCLIPSAYSTFGYYIKEVGKFPDTWARFT